MHVHGERWPNLTNDVDDAAADEQRYAVCGCAKSPMPRAFDWAHVGCVRSLRPFGQHGVQQVRCKPEGERRALLSALEDYTHKVKTTATLTPGLQELS